MKNSNLRKTAPQAPKADPEPEKLLQMATGALERQDWTAAEGYLRGLTQCYPDLHEPYLSLSDVLTLQGKHQEAAEVLRAARQVDPEALPLLKRLGLNCRQRGDFSGAMAAFTRAWSQNPRDPEILGHLAATCNDMGLFQESKDYFAEAVRRNPQDIELWLGLARVARQLEDQCTFGQACRRAGALNPAHPRLLELTAGWNPGNGGAAPSTPGEVHDRPHSSPERILPSIIIPVFNNLPLTRQCLESVWGNTDAPHEIIVVDNGSNDGTRDYLQPLADAGGLRVITNPTNLGFARASNQGAQAARGEYLVFLNNDTIVQPGWLEELAACARKDEKIGAVGAKLLYPDDTIQHAGVTFNYNKLAHHIYRHYDKDHPAVNKEREFQAVTAACVLIKKDSFFAAGGFDEAYQNGFEDVDLCFKLRDHGYKIVYNPRAVIYHLESKTQGRHDREKENSLRLRSKWFDKIIGDDHKYHQEDGIVIEEIERRGNVSYIHAHDSNDNIFWREAVKYRQEGVLDKAEACYLRALRFNPFDSRKALVAQELADLYETLGKHSQAEKLRRLLAGLAPREGLREVAETPQYYMEEELDMRVSELLKIMQERIITRSCYFGIKTQKSPLDFWVYQEIISHIKPDYIVEIGNFNGGSTLALAHLLDILGHGEVIGIDINHAGVPQIVINHPRIKLITGDACASFDLVRKMIPYDSKVIVIEDSSHTFENTLNVLRKYCPIVNVGSYFIVEDSICHHGLDLGPNPGPYEAIEQFIRENNNFEIDRTKEPFLVTWNPKGYLKRVP